jgi:hypothetical protein
VPGVSQALFRPCVARNLATQIEAHEQTNIHLAWGDDGSMLYITGKSTL